MERHEDRKGSTGKTNKVQALFDLGSGLGINVAMPELTWDLCHK